MKAKLLSKTDVGEGVDLVFGARATIGRADGNTLVLEPRAVSSRHAEIVFDADAGAYFLEDLGSLNGTELDGIRMIRRERLGRLHAISFGGAVELIYVALDLDPDIDEEVASAPEDDDKTSFDKEMPTLPEGLLVAAGGTEGTRVEKLVVPLPEALAGGAPPAPEQTPKPSPSPFYLEFDDSQGPRYLDEGENLVGRLKSAGVSLPSPDLSRRHATITVNGETVLLRDEGSRNHTSVDGVELAEEVEVSVGSVLHFGHVEARLKRREGSAGTTREESSDNDGEEED